MDSSDVIAIVAIANASLSLWLAYRLAARQEHQRWLRESKQRVYEDLLTQAQVRRGLLRRAIRSGEVVTPAVGQDPANLATRVELYASPEVQARWHDFGIVQAEVMSALPPEHDQVLYLLVELDRVRNELLTSVRRDMARPAQRSHRLPWLRGDKLRRDHIE
jgi:hypothetical protein